MKDQERNDILKTSWDIHGLVERSYLAMDVKKDDPEWPEKQRLLLADMALHLLQTALAPGELPTDKLKNNIHAVLTISDQFLPEAGLKAATDKIYD